MDQVFELSQSGSIKVLRVHNLLSEFANREILSTAQSCIDEGFNRFVVDLEGMPYTNSVGLNFLISLQSRCQDQGGSIVMVNVSKKIIQLLEITKLQPLFHLTDSVDEALRLLKEV
jgi:anti-sigma B factor antagonist